MKVTAYELRGELQQYFLKEKRGNIWLTDMWYWKPKLQEVEKFLKVSWTDKRIYIANTWDCDDFALKLLADCRDYTRWLIEFEILKKEDVLPWAFCEVWAKGHFFNTVLTSNNGLLFIEPQTDKIQNPDNILIYARG